MAEFRIYRKYQPENGKSPFLRKIEEVFAKEKLTNRLSEVADAAGVSRQTPDRWINGKTVSCQDATAGAVLGALGYEVRLVKVAKIDLEEEIEATQRWLEMRNSKIRRRNGHAAR